MYRFIVALIACATLKTAAAAERNPLEASFIVDAGTFLMSTDIRVRADGETTNERGTDFDFDETFGIGDFDRFRAEAFWRIAGRHAIRALYFENNRSATRAIDREISFGDVTFPPDSTIDASSTVTVVQLSYQYAFLRGENYELAGGLGIHYLDLGLSLAGRGGEFTREEDTSSEAPLPVLGVHWLWRLPHNFYVSAQAQYFYIEVDPYSGSLVDLKASVVWQFTDHIGLGVGYNDFGFRFDIEDQPRFNGRLRWDYGGTLAFVTVMF